MKIEELQSYEVVENRKIEDLNSDSYILRHKKTGARVVLLSNDDENKVFCIGFRTPPENSTGVAHILEHSVLCGSEKFPVKDPFIELAKGSLNTFINAMTYPDKTIYPIASCNDKDFHNLMHVYLDAVFHPNIYSQDKIFRQEGWHYEMEDEGSDLTINGVVYNEMKGAFSSPDDVLDREIMNSLYPDTTYHHESGGDPKNIPELSYEEFLAFHQKYYHPSNSYIYLYGNMDMAEKLDFIDQEYLSAYEEKEIDSCITVQQPFAGMQTVEREYPINEEDAEEENAYLAYNLAVGDVLDQDLCVAFQILDYALGTAPGAPLKQALVEKGIGTEVFSDFDKSIRQPMFSVVAKNTDVLKKQEFLDTINEVLQNVVKEGLDKKALLAGLNHYEFRYREADFGSYPAGLMYCLQLFTSWLHDDRKPFIHIESNATFARMRKMVEENGFEKLIQERLLENSHSSLVVLIPKKGLAAKQEQETKEKLEAIRGTLSAEQIRQIVEETHALREWQETPDKKEDLEKIPLLTRADMKKEAARLVNEVRDVDGTKVLFHNLFTNQIAYLRLIFKADKVPAELFPYLGILKGVLGLLDTENYQYKDLFNEMNIISGGMAPVHNLYGDLNDPDKYTVTLEFKTKVLYSNLGKAVEMMREILLTTKYDDYKRLGEILAEGKSQMQGQMLSAGHSVAVKRVLSYVSKTSAVNEALNGMDFYRLVERLTENFDTQASELGEKLQELSKYLFTAENLMVDFIGDEAGYEPVPGLIRALKQDLFEERTSKDVFVPEVSVKNEGFKTAGQVQYVCRGGNFKKQGLPYHGSLKVLKTMIAYDYLWNNVRVKNGAYDCMCALGKSGDGYMASYRDPNLDKTLEIYEKAADYIASFEADERTLTQFVIGAVSEQDVPMTPATKGLFSLSSYMTGVTQESLQKDRDELLATSIEDIRRGAEYIRAILSENCVCVVGNGDMIEASKDNFDKTENLF